MHNAYYTAMANFSLLLQVPPSTHCSKMKPGKGRASSPAEVLQLRDQLDKAGGR